MSIRIHLLAIAALGSAGVAIHLSPELGEPALVFALAFTGVGMYLGADA